jgi:hypothetical protein
MNQAHCTEADEGTTIHNLLVLLIASVPGGPPRCRCAAHFERSWVQTLRQISVHPKEHFNPIVSSLSTRTQQDLTLLKTGTHQCIFSRELQYFHSECYLLADTEYLQPKQELASEKTPE